MTDVEYCVVSELDVRMCACPKHKNLKLEEEKGAPSGTIITARFESTCPSCGTHINRGDQVAKWGQKWICIDCHYEVE